MTLRTLQSTSSDVLAYQELFSLCPRIADIIGWSRRINVRWVDEILTRNTLSAPSAVSGEPVDAVGILSTSSRTTFVEFAEPGREPYCLVASRVGIGYQIGSIYFSGRGLLFNWEDQRFGFGRAAVDNYHVLKQHRAKHAVAPLEEGFCLLLGHENFAHHLLNELSGVWRAKEAGLLGRVRKVFTQYEPLGALNELIPEFADVPRRSVTLAENFDVLANNNILMIGGAFIPSGLRERMRARVDDLATRLHRQETDKTLSTPGPRVSLAVRLHSRVVENNNQMMLALCRELRERVGTLTPVLDGFSLPHDLAVNPNYTPWFKEKGAQSAAQVGGVAEQFRQAGYGDVLTTADNDIILALWMSMQTSYYFSNHGTQQHKAGWLSNASGVVHFPPDHSDGAVGWFQRMNKGGRAFKVLPKEFVRALSQHKDQASAGYEFHDIEKAAVWTADALTGVQTTPGLPDPLLRERAPSTMRAFDRRRRGGLETDNTI